MQTPFVSDYRRLLALTLLAAAAPLARAQAVDNAPSAASSEETVQLSPFEVVAENKGYYAANSMSGTRLNSKIEDMPTSVQVVSKEQMADFAMLDINDIFLYAGNAEGTGTFTDFTVNRNGDIFDNVQLDPQQANRIRGVGPANIALSNVETMGRMPIDPSAIDAVEVSRGPNANVFGLGNSSGTVNMVGASANLTRNRSQVSFRVDSYDGYRGSIDLNRVLKKNVLSARLTAVRQHEGFVRKPSGIDTDRVAAMVKYRPFRTTTINASYQLYDMAGRRPNSTTPRDYVSYWISKGRPTWDPLTSQVHLNGQTVGTFTSSTGLPDYFSGSYYGNSRSQVFVDQTGIGYWSAPNGVSGTNPNSNAQSQRFIATGPAPVRVNQPLFTTNPAINDKSLYDWTKLNYAAANWTKEKTEISQVNLEQILLNTPSQTLVAHASWVREDSERYTRNLIGIAGEGGATGALQVDVNERLLDGTPNPYFLRPFIGVAEPITQKLPQRWDTYRLQLAYKLDLTQQRNALSWLGRHQITGYDEYKNRISRMYTFRDVIVDNHAWINPGVGRANQGVNGGPNITRSFFRFYVGDNQGQNMDYAAGNFTYGTYPFVWGNAATGVFNREPTQLGMAASQDKSAGSRNSFTILKTQGGVIQSFFLKDKLITTIGVRNDDSYVKFANPSRLQSDGITYDYDYIDHWAPGDYTFRSGRTSSRGLVVRPFRDIPGLVRESDNGVGLRRFAAELFRNVSFHYNESDSFRPASPAQTIMLDPVPNPQGDGKDYGFTLTLLDGRLNIRLNRYTTTQLYSRNVDTATLGSRLLNLDYAGSQVFQLKTQATRWIAATQPNLTPDQLKAAVEKTIGFTSADEDALDAIPRAETDDVRASGTELTVNYNPSRFGTLQLNFSESEAVNSNLSTSVTRFVQKRMSTWAAIKDPTINAAVEPNQLWWTHNYGGSQTAEQYYQSQVASPLLMFQALEGKARPQIAKYRGSLSGNYRLAGISDHAVLKAITVGGALRWHDKSAIGFYGKQQLPASITDLDINRPIWSKDRFYADAFISYRTRLFSNRIGASFQLNVRNLQENGRLQAVGAYPDGTPYSFRIVDPRQFILTATFDL